jgi:hypothetical protein
MRLRFDICLSLFLLFCLGSESHANTVVRMPVCEWYPTAAVVFVGTATKISEVTDRSARIKFSVTEHFKGVTTPDVELVCTGFAMIGGGLDFNVGENYLVAAYRDKKGEVQLGPCDLSAAPSNEVEEDIIFLRSLNGKNRPKTVIYGAIKQLEGSGPYNRPEIHPLAGIPIRLSGPTGVVDTVSRLDGYFEFPDVVSGEYRVTPLLPKTFPQASQQVTVGSSGCAVASFNAFEKQ